MAFGPHLAAFYKLFSKQQLHAELEAIHRQDKQKETYMDIYKEVINQIKANIIIIGLKKLNSKGQNEISTPFSNEVEKVIDRLKSEFLLIYKQID